MKQAIITGLKKELLLVERDGVLLQTWRDIYDAYPVIGKLTDIKEEQFELFVNSWNSYEGNQFENHREYGSFGFYTAKESFFSKLEADGIWFKNKLGKHKPTRLAESDGTLQTLDWHRERWQEAQSKVWDINSCWLFEII